MSTCPCGSGRPLALCCQPFISGTAKPPTAEALMRSRYTAYATQAVDYIVSTCIDNGKESVDIESTRKWSQESEWLGLKIIDTVKGGPLDSEGEVEFIASYSQDGHPENLRERSSFKKVNGYWKYDTGRIITETVVRSTPKIGRNDPCSCGSGKKYKQCHGKN